METYPLSLALFDFFPTLAFLAGAVFLVKIVLLKREKTTTGLVTAGTLLVFLGGFLKACWKLLVALNVADIQWMSQGQFVLSAFGFLGMCAAVISLVRGLRMKKPVRKAALGMAVWKMPFLIVMTLSSLAANGLLAYLCLRRKARLAAAGYVISLLGLLGMGAMASAGQTLTMQWIEEAVNSLGQLGFLMGCLLLHRDFTNRGFLVRTRK